MADRPIPFSAPMVRALLAGADGLGPAGGEEPKNADEFVRTFNVPPIQKRAADIIDELAVALRPFAEAADDAERTAGHDGPLGQYLDLPHLRRARAAISKLASLSNE